ncbi:uncharacterized protein LOC125487478 [Rhincodon typus]|uniref:uncharacterized protein LOC125487478 n=1 Tax=Rhincodon typus TaxID=259920 RepID=UPI002030942D|nr:uncharacterized protein LOC125487478 [Rhincodon typus]
MGPMENGSASKLDRYQADKCRSPCQRLSIAGYIITRNNGKLKVKFNWSFFQRQHLTKYIDGGSTVYVAHMDFSNAFGEVAPWNADPQGYFSQSVTQAPIAVTKKECQSLTITCVYYGHNWGYYFEHGWFLRQTQTRTDRERISSGGRFVVRMNKEEKTFSLEIRDVRVEDTASYYCKASYNYDRHMPLCREYNTVIGPGTAVTITADSISLVSQSPPLQTYAVSDAVALSCEYSGFCQYAVYWYSQSPRQAPKYLLQGHSSGEEKKENAATERLSASIDPAAKITQLKISAIQLNDSGVYYCALSRRSGHTAI